jgi:diketogulonate reductase-like aldo/keto reductase
MQIPSKKLKTGFEMPVYCLGTWLMGGDKDRNPNNNDEKDIHTIQMNIDNGVDMIFTAQNYAEGYCEELVGRAISKYPREKIAVCTAIARANASYDDVLKSFEESLARMKIDYVDIVYHHARCDNIPIKETIRGLTKLVDEGKAKHIAVSNYSKESLKKAQDSCTYPIVANQVHYNLLVRESEISGLVEYCQDNDVIVQAYRPLSQGLLTKKDKYKLLGEMCEKYTKTPPQIALNWLLSQPNVTVCCTTSNEKHLKENFGAFAWQMEEKDIEKLRKEFPDQIQVGECGKLG